MIVDALILAGGRSSRLGDSDKQNLRIGNSSLLERTVEAVRSVDVRQVVVVGDGELDGVDTVRETPVFAGPVAAIAAGAGHLPDSPADVLLILACDMPRIAAALPRLLSSFTGDGFVAVDRGRRQQLVLAVAPASLQRALDGMPAIEDASVRELLAGLDLTEVVVPDGSTDDIDTWDDAALFGAVAPETTGA